MVGDWLARQRAARRFVCVMLNRAGLLDLSVLLNSLWFFAGRAGRQGLESEIAPDAPAYQTRTGAGPA